MRCVKCVPGESTPTSAERMSLPDVRLTMTRDMYRLLLAQETNKDVAASNAESNGVSSGVSAAAAQEADAMKSRVHELERVRF